MVGKNGILKTDFQVKKRFNYLLILLGIFFGFFLSVSPIYAGQVVVSWDPPATDVDGSPITDLAGFKIYYGMASGNYSTVVDVGLVTSYTVTGLTGNLAYYFAVTAYDATGNESNFSNEISKTITDSIPPIISNTTVNNITASEATINWTTNENSTSQVEYGTTTSYGSTTTLDSTLVTSHSVKLTGLSSWTSYHFRVRSQDASGNIAMSSDLTFTTMLPPDTVSPTGTISINDGAAYTASPTVTLALSCSDSSGCNQMQFSSDGTTWSALETYAMTKGWTLSSGDGTKTVYARYRDGAGNTSSSYTDQITLDLTAPTGTLLINSGAAAVNTTLVTLSLSCTDSGSSCSQMQFSNDGTAWSALETYATSRGWTLSSGDGTKTAYVRYRDAAGNTSSSSTDQVILDMTTPVISAIQTSNVTDTSATITWTTNETSSSQVEFGASSSLGSFSTNDTNLATSHSITLSNLSPATTYHFKALSVDALGNSAVSTENIFVTLQTVQPDIPSAIIDLRVRDGASTRNSLYLDWSATGADGTVGTVSSYDLRMSKSKIIQDGGTPGSGEINFSNAVQVAGTPVPEPAGTLQSVQVTGFETNTVYYFAIKAIDDKGNKSSLSNVVNGDHVPPLPVTAVRQGYTMISFPLVPATSDVQTLLAGIVGSPVELYSWSSSGINNPQNAFVVEQNVVPGYGYFLKTDRSNAVLDITGTPVTDPTRAIPLQSGWNMIGNPYPAEIALSNTQIRNIGTGEVKSYADAVAAGWVGNALYSFNGSTYSFVFHVDSVMQPWQGYWMVVLQDGLFELVITKP